MIKYKVKGSTQLSNATKKLVGATIANDGEWGLTMALGVY